MGINKIEIHNYKSIKKCILDFSRTSLFIGENGCGKTNILSAIKYFMQNLGSDDEINECGNIFDINNEYSNCIKISIYFNMDRFSNITSNQLLSEKKYRSYYQKIRKLSQNEFLEVTMVKTKDKKIKWSLLREDRRILFSLFPVYYLDSRNINLLDWSELWHSIGDLVKLDNEVSKEIMQIINQNIEECKDKRFSYTLSRIKEIINNSSVKILEFTPKEYSNSLVKTYLQGEKFIYNTKKLSYSSNGTNSFNYTIFLLEILELISKSKLKSPTILLDEPELSLHHTYIDELSNKLFESGNYVKSIISTHSPRFVKRVLQQDGKNEVIYKVSMKNNYTEINSMKLFYEKEIRERNSITDEHANAYFSNFLLCVEGESELGFYNNKYIKDLFPFLKSVDVFKSIADNVVSNIILPGRRNYSTPYIILMDMDKACYYDKTNSKFALTSIFPSSKHAYSYYLSYKRIYLNTLFKRINGIINKANLRYDRNWGYCEDKYFSVLISLIKEYLSYHSIFVNKTTLEGMVVNIENYDSFKEFFIKKLKGQEIIKFNNIYSSFVNKSQKCNYLRLLCSGKADIILNTDELIIPPAERQFIESVRFSKTDGWMNSFIEYFIFEFIKQQGMKCSNFSQYKSIINKNPRIKELLKNEFIINFKELSDLLSLIELTINGII